MIDWAAWTPKDRATLLFVVERDRILLIRKKRGLGAGKINGPGGRLEAGESPLACAIRETEEELGITPSGVTERGTVSFHFVDGYDLFATVFFASAYTGTPIETDEAIPIWSPLDAIPYDEMWKDDSLWLPLALDGKRFDGRFVFDGDAMLWYEIDVA